MPKTINNRGLRRAEAHNKERELKSAIRNNKKIDCYPTLFYENQFYCPDPDNPYFGQYEYLHLQSEAVPVGQEIDRPNIRINAKTSAAGYVSAVNLIFGTLLISYAIYDSVRANLRANNNPPIPAPNPAPQPIPPAYSASKAYEKRTGGDI